MADQPEDRRLQKKLERAKAYLDRNDLVAARAAYEAIAGVRPGEPATSLQLLRVAEAQGRYRDAHALAIDLSQASLPTIETTLRTAQGLARHGESLAAISVMKQLDIGSCDDAAILLEFAQLAILLDESTLAREIVARLAVLRPESPGIVYQQGVLEVFSGNLPEAGALLERCLQLAPDFAQAHWSISKLRRQTPASNHVDRLRKLLETATDNNVPSIAFALFKELDDLGEFKDAWSALAHGSRVKRAGLNYNAADSHAGFQRLETLHEQGHFSRQSQALTQTGPAPIFIVGLPRSGTTVLEQLLSAHPEVTGAGELPDFAAQMRWVGNRYSRRTPDAALIDSVARSNTHEVGTRYLQRTQWRAQGRAYYSDKAPLNFLNAGFILKSISNAQVIHIRKTPMDACFSNLKELFTKMYPHTYQLDEMADYYQDYRSLVARWSSPDSVTDRVIEVSYDDLVTAPETTMRSVLSAIGLPWHQGCSGLDQSSADVSTASAAQVREPIHARTLGQWKNYSQWLGPLVDKVA